MIVRLKDIYLQEKHVTIKFQFYDSPIKSIALGQYSLAEAKFQFYDSPIKSRHRTSIVRLERNWVSIL